MTRILPCSTLSPMTITQTLLTTSWPVSTKSWAITAGSIWAPAQSHKGRWITKRQFLDSDLVRMQKLIRIITGPVWRKERIKIRTRQNLKVLPAQAAVATVAQKTLETQNIPTTSKKVSGSNTTKEKKETHRTKSLKIRRFTMKRTSMTI